MKIKIKNLGILKQAEFTVGDLTIICGENNTGKTYATCALFGFLKFWKKSFSMDIKKEEIDQLLNNGVVSISIPEYFSEINKVMVKGCQEYTKQLPKIFASSEDNFKNTEFQIETDISKNLLNIHYETSLSSANKKLFSFLKEKDSQDLIVTLLSRELSSKELKQTISTHIIQQVISDTLKELIFGEIFPNIFIISAERTGTAIFRKELNFARNRLLEEISQTDKNIDPLELLFKGYDDYALPIKSNVDFTRNLEDIAKKKSFIVEKYPQLLKDFTDIIGGDYTVTQNDELYYIPKGKRIKLTMGESSSAIRSLLDLGFYLKHIAELGDLLIIDEPELNLHPKNQCRIARLLARLVNIGIKVFITTHSDYLIKELNTLIMLNQDKPYLKEIAQREGYQTNELLKIDQIKVYIAENALVKLDGKKRKTRCQTLTKANITPNLGIELGSFDTVIEKMNRIQEEIIWGE